MTKVFPYIGYIGIDDYEGNLLRTDLPRDTLHSVGVDDFDLHDDPFLEDWIQPFTQEYQDWMDWMRRKEETGH